MKKKIQHSYCHLVRILFFFLVPFSLFSQNKFSSEPGKFLEDVNGMFHLSKNEAILSIGTNFSAAWGSYSPAHQKKIIALTQAMQKTKRYRLTPHYCDYFSVLSAAKNKNLQSVQIDSLLFMLEKSVVNLSGGQVQSLLQVTRLFLEKDFLYKSNYNSLAVAGGTFSFSYKEPAGEVIPVEEPVINESDTASAPDLDKRKEDFFSDWDNPDQVANEWGTLNEDTLQGQNILDVGYAPPLQPTIEGPVITFNHINFNIKTHYDSVTFTGTSGSLMLKNLVFVGKGGKFDWSCAGLPPEDVYCDIKDYNFNIKSPKIICEGATLHYPSKTDKAVDGIFEFDSKKHKTPEENLFPRFKSFTNNVPVKGLGDFIRYTGGFAMGGRKIYSSSIDEGIGTIEILHNDTVKVRSVSYKFQLGDSLITADLSNIVLYQGDQDSIYHPGNVFHFNKNDQVLKLYKHKNFRHAPFVDTYHKLEIVADALTWNLNNPQIDFGIINSKDQIPATFESEEYFNGNKYSVMTGLYKFHPLQMVYGYSEKVGSKEFFADDVAKANKLQPLTVRGSMVELMKRNFIDYDVKTGLIKLKQKTGHYVMSRRNKKDYDNINFISIEPSGNNASYNLANHELIVRGVEKLYISDSLSVYFTPENKEVKILKGRDFMFNGEISTQNFLFKGKNFLFNYDSFLVHMPNIDYIKLSVQKSSGKDSSKTSKKSLGNELTYSSGILYINKPNNKSGRIKYVQYPIFESTTGATVTFNKPNIAHGAYDTSMKFKIPPFKLDSLASDDQKAIGFEGDFDSGGIFPPFKERLVVMPDLSLGFKHKIPDEGFQLYGGKGKYYNQVTLDNQGLRGEGEIKYLNAVLYSKDFLFMKDCVMTVGTKFINKEGTSPSVSPDVKFPDMYVENYKLKWVPRSDKMFISDNKDPIQFYKNTASLQGTANLTSRGMFGEGILLTRGSESESHKFHFEMNRFSGRDATFRIQSDNPKKPAMFCRMVKLEFDLLKGLAYFSPEVAGSASNEFPYAMYKSSLNNGTWDLKKKTVTMKMPEGGDINKSYFYSTRLDQDSLVFNATEAVYDITKLTLNIKGIPYIKVADGKIFPEGNKVFIEENAVIQKLEKAKIILDTIHEYHHLYNASIEIKSRLKFEGEAIYQYVNLGSDTLAIKFIEFTLSQDEKKNSKPFTLATGIVKEEDNLKIGPKIFYKGKVIMKAPNKYLTFDGFVKLDLQGELKNSQWMKYTNSGESSQVVINISNNTGDNGHLLSTGLHVDNSTADLYITFISEKKTIEDADIMTSNGLLNYNGENNSFTVASEAKLKDNTKKGNLISYNDAKSTIHFQGGLNLFKINKSMSPKAAGTGTGSLKDNSYSFNTLLQLDLKMHSSVYSALGKSFKQIVQFLEDSTAASVKDLREKSLPNKIIETSGVQEAEKYKFNALMFNGSLAKLSADYAKSIVLSDVNLKWSPEHKSFYSEGPIFVSNIGKEDIGKPTKGFVEIRKIAGGEDIINIYLEPMENGWFFFTYDQNRLGAVTSNEYINRSIQDKSDGEKMDRTKFFFVHSQPSEKSKFLADFKEKYMGIKNNYNEEEEEIPSESDELPAVPSPAGKNKEEENEEVGDHTASHDYEINDKPMSPSDKKKAKKYKNNTDFDMLKYKEEEELKKKQSTVEERKKSQEDQKKLKELLGN